MSDSTVRAKWLLAALVLAVTVLANIVGAHPQESAPPGTRPESRDTSLEARARRIHRGAIVFDGHIDVVRYMMQPGWKFTDRHPPNNALEDHVDLPRLKDGGITGGFFAIADNDRLTGASLVQDSLRQLDLLRSVAEAMPDQVMLCLTASDVRRAKAAGKVAMVLAVEGGHMINDSFAVLRTYARLGIRYMTLAHNVHASWADSSSRPPQHNGLTTFGREVVQEMNRLGIIVDISHVSDETFYDALETSRAPIFASHSAARALSAHPRNLTDEMIKALAAKGGVIAINFHAGFLDAAFLQARQKLFQEVSALRKEIESRDGQAEALKRGDEALVAGWARLPKVPWTLIVDHIDHAVKLVGVNHVALGSDFDGAPMPDGLDDASYVPRITEELFRRGYRPRDIEKILGGNILRLLERVEAVSKSLNAETGGMKPRTSK
jgi:membrane dipeptidase